MGLPGGITKDTSARKNTAPVAPHDAALQAYMHSFLQSIEQGYKVEWFGRHTDHGRDVKALKAHMSDRYNKAYAELVKKYSADQEQLTAKRNAKMLEIQTDFAQDPLAAIARHHSNASASKSPPAPGPTDAGTAEEPTRTSKNVEEALARAFTSFVKKSSIPDDRSAERQANGTEESTAAASEEQAIKSEPADYSEDMPIATEIADVSRPAASHQDVPAEAPPCSQSKPWWAQYPVTAMTKPQQLALGEKLVALNKPHLTSGSQKHSTTLSTLVQKVADGQYSSLREFAKDFVMSLNDAAKDDVQTLFLIRVSKELKAAFEPAMATIVVMKDVAGHAEIGQAEKKGRADSVVG